MGERTALFEMELRQLPGVNSPAGLRSHDYVAEKVIAIRGAGPVATAADAVKSLVELGVLASAKPYIEMVRFRDLIVHEYEEIDPGLLYDLACNRTADFRAYRDDIDSAGRLHSE